MATTAAEKELESTQVWDPNPTVVISKRHRSLLFPKLLILRDLTQEDEEAWKKAEDELLIGRVHLDARQEQPLYLGAGVNFIGTYSTVFSFKKIENNQAPTDPKGRPIPPSPDKLVLLYPQTPVWRSFEGPSFVDPVTRTILAPKVNDAFKRILRYMRSRDEGAAATEGKVGLFQPPPGFDAPEIMVMPLNDVLAQKGAEGQAAYQYMMSGIRFCKNLGFLGALHDYAHRHKSGWNVVEACRARSMAFKTADDE